jgi:glutamate/tyrosine decarboxylase-like PLP-dependent enzyme
VTERSVQYLGRLQNGNVFPSSEAIDALTKLDEPLPDGPSDIETVIDLLDNIGSPATVLTAGGRYFGFVIGGSLPAALAANWLAGAWDQNAGLRVASPIASVLEQITLGWLLDVLSLPAEAGGGFVSGATMANFTALAAARHALLKKQGWDVEAKGLFGAPPVTVIVGDEVHVSVLKALSLLGFGRDRVIRVPVDRQGRLRPDGLPELPEPAIVCIQAGNVNTGAFDPANEICAAAQRAGAWVHVDGAFGLWAAATPQHAQLTSGFEKADSWAIDAHKWLNVPYDSGIAFCRNPEHLCGAMSTRAAYLLVGEQREPYHYVPEMSRRARGIEIWAALRSLGRSGLSDLIERTCNYARRFARGLTQAGYRVLNDVVLNQVLVAFGDAETTRRVIEGVQTDGTCWCGGTEWQGHTAMRISVSSWATTDADVDRSLAAILRIAKKEIASTKNN